MSNKKYYKKLKFSKEMIDAVLLKNEIPPLTETAFNKLDKEFVAKIKAFQQKKGLKADGILGNNTLFEMECDFLNLSDNARAELRTIHHIVMFESGGRPDAANIDGEFRGLFGKNHPAYQTSHIGLSLGYIQMTQDGGSLGEYLQYCYEQDPVEFKKIMGEAETEAVLKVVTAKGKSGFSQRILRGPRVQKIVVKKDRLIEGDLWDKYFLERCQAIARHPKFRILQYDIAISNYLNPMRRMLKNYGAYSEKAVAVALDLSIHYGPGRAQEIFAKYWNHAQTEKANLERIAKELTAKRISGKLKITKSRPQRLLENNDIGWNKWKGFE